MKMDRVIAGLVILAVGLWAVVSWWWFLVDVIKGIVAVGLVFAGLVLVGLGVKDGISDLTGMDTAGDPAGE